MRTHTTLIDQKIVENGTVIHQNFKKETKVPIEPNYVKLYLDDLGKIMDLQKSQRNLLDILLSKMEKDTLRIVLSTGLKREICKELKTSIPTLNNNLSFLMKMNVIDRLDIGLYRGNPFLFGKGSWDNIYEIRLEIEYNRKGRIIKANIKQTE